MQQEALTAIGSNLQKGEYGAAVAEAVKIFKKRGYLKPRRVPNIALYEVIVAQPSRSMIYIPTIRAMKSSYAYSVKPNGSYELIAKKGRDGKATSRRCPARIARLVTQEIVRSRLNKNIWCADITVDADYYLVILSVLDPERHAQLTRRCVSKINPIRGTRLQEDEFKLINELDQIKDVQISRCLKAIDISAQRVEVSERLKSISSEVDCILQRYLSQQGECKRESLIEFFTVVAGMVRAHSQLKTCISSVKRFKLYCEINKDALLDNGIDASTFAPIDPMNYGEDDVLVSDELAEFGTFVAKQAGFATEAQLISFPSYPMPMFSEEDINKYNMASDRDAFKLRMSQLKNEQLTEGDVETCVKYGWTFTDDKRLFHRKSACGYQPIEHKNLIDYFTTTPEGIKQLDRINRGMCTKVQKPIKLITEKRDDVYLTDIDDVDFEGENGDILLEMADLARDNHDDNRLMSLATHFGDKIIGPTVELIYQYLKNTLLGDVRRRGKSPALPTMEFIKARIVSVANNRWPETQVGLAAMDILSRYPQYLTLIRSCEPIKKIGGKVCKQVFKDAEYLMEHVVNAWIEQVYEEVQVAIKEMQSTSMNPGASVFAFKRYAANYLSLSNDTVLNSTKMYSLYCKMADLKLTQGFRTVLQVASSGMTAGTAMSAGAGEVHGALTDILTAAHRENTRNFPHIDYSSRNSVETYFGHAFSMLESADPSAICSGYETVCQHVLDDFSKREEASLSTIVWQPLTYVSLLLLVSMLVEYKMTVCALIMKLNVRGAVRKTVLTTLENEIKHKTEVFSMSVVGYFECMSTQRLTFDMDKVLQAVPTLLINAKNPAWGTRETMLVILNYIVAMVILGKNPIVRLKSINVESDGKLVALTIRRRTTDDDFFVYPAALRRTTYHKLMTDSPRPYVTKLSRGSDVLHYFEQASEIVYATQPIRKTDQTGTECIIYTNITKVPSERKDPIYLREFGTIFSCRDSGSDFLKRLHRSVQDDADFKRIYERMYSGIDEETRSDINKKIKALTK